MPEFLWDDGAALITDARAEGPRSPVAFQVSGNKRKCGAGFWGLCEDSSPEQGHPVRMSRRASVVGAGAAQDGHLWSQTAIPQEQGEPWPGLHGSGVAQPSWTKPEDKKPPEKKEKRYKESALPRMDICGLRQRFPRSKGSLGLACTAQHKIRIPRDFVEEVLVTLRTGREQAFVVGEPEVCKSWICEKNTNSQPFRPDSSLQRELSTHPQKQVQYLKEKKKRPNQKKKVICFASTLFQVPKAQATFALDFDWVAKTCLGNRNDSKPRLKAAEAETSFQCLIPLITYVVQKMPIMTMPTHPESETMEKRQKMMVLRTIKEDKNPEKAFKIYERYQYAKSTEVQKLKPNTDEEANPAEEEDEEVWEDGDSGHRRLGEAQLQHILSGKGHKRSTELNPSLNASSED
ncbi:hypothetical protein DUI87_15473 [Hirundo rustica rustica]|uniref:Uncharacterized protein n=1 Tax=Hirundo rustica rustica TaxID=333673 RepID=A0A3M0K651_HIRRU|nr:hypothetical protein DUI87_15473 [Hirundo rustica rustica]